MNAPKVCYLLLALCIAASCKKETQPLKTETSGTAAELYSSQAVLQTTHGLLVAKGGFDSTAEQLDYAGIKLTRLNLFLSEKTKSGVIDKYLKNGYHVQVNLNWANVAFGPQPFPTNIENIKKRAEEFFKYYAPQKDQIPVVVVENEWDNILYHKGSIDDYLNELAAITEVGHKYGFKIADAGITSTGLRRWAYTQFSEEEAAEWFEQYWVGGKLDNFNLLVKAVNYYTASIRNIPIDYLNVHWYNIDGCFDGFDKCTEAYKEASNKTSLICNEFGIKLNSEELFDATVNELSGRVAYAIAYSGTGTGDGKSAVRITDSMLAHLRK